MKTNRPSIRMKHILWIIISCLAISACGDETIISKSYERFYRVDSIYCKSKLEELGTVKAPCFYIHAHISSEDEYQEEIRALYGNDATYHGRRYYGNFSHGNQPNPIEAVDWRATDIDIIALSDWDDKYPAGSSLRDKFILHYRRNDEAVEKPLSSFKYGDMMLVDYIFGDPFTGFYIMKFMEPDITPCKPVLYLKNKKERDKFFKARLEVHIKDIFGNHFVAISEPREEQ